MERLFGFFLLPYPCVIVNVYSKYFFLLFPYFHKVTVLDMSHCCGGFEL